MPDSDSDESIDNDSDTDSKGDDSSEEDDEEADIRRIFALINSGFDEDADRFDPEAEEENTMLTAMKHSMIMKSLGV